MNFRQLECFVILSEELNYRKAAERLYISQPSLTAHMQNLQKDVGIALFARNGRRIELTQAGQVFLVRARNILKQISVAEMEISSFQEDQHRQLKIGVSGSHLFYPILKDFRSNFSDTKLVLKEFATFETAQKLINHELDLGITFGPIDDPELVFEYLFTDEFVVVGQMNGVLQEYTQIKLEALTKLPLVGLHDEFYIRKFVDQILITNLLIPQYEAEVTTYHNCLNVISSLDLVAIMPLSFMRNYDILNKNPELKIIPVNDVYLRQPVGVSYSKSQALRNEVNWVVENLKHNYQM